MEGSFTFQNPFSMPNACGSSKSEESDSGRTMVSTDPSGAGCGGASRRGARLSLAAVAGGDIGDITVCPVFVIILAIFD